MNVYEKLVQARIEFQDLGVKMGGKNDYAGYQYFELSDILPAVNKIAQRINFVCEVSFTPELATLTFRDTESPESSITFTSPMSSAALKGCHEVQNLGAVETYIKRYLYQNAFEIVEADALNKTHNPNEKPAIKPEVKPAPKTDHPTAQEQCQKLSAEMGLDKEEKARMWQESGQNYSNLLIMLKDYSQKKLDAINAAFDKVGV